MFERPSSLLDRVRQPRYTGENRCLPCTAINVAIAGGASLLLGLGNVALGAAAFAAALAVIYLRGYLVPGTPALTERFLPDRVLAAFEKAPPGETGADDQEEEDSSWETVEKVRREREAGIEPAEFLEEVGAVEPCEDGEAERCPTEAFAAAVDRTLERDAARNPDPAIVAALFDADADDVSREDRDYPAYRVGHRVRRWPSPAALRLDVATDAALSEWTDRWAEVPVRHRHATRELLRSLRERCPDCGGELEARERTVESCCRTGQVTAVDCADCGERVLESAP